MAEWFNASDLKSEKFKISWVQIPFSPYYINKIINIKFYLLKIMININKK